MPELPDICLYISVLDAGWKAHVFEQIELASPFVLRTVEPAINELCGKKLLSVTRVGKRVAFQFEPDYWMVIHLMIAGRFQWVDAGGRLPGRKSRY